jgi:hypothetical protein
MSSYFVTTTAVHLVHNQFHVNHSKVIRELLHHISEGFG